MNESNDRISSTVPWFSTRTETIAIVLGVCYCMTAVLIATRDCQLDLKLKHKDLELDVVLSEPRTPEQ